MAPTTLTTFAVGRLRAAPRSAFKRAKTVQSRRQQATFAVLSVCVCVLRAKEAQLLDPC